MALFPVGFFGPDPLTRLYGQAKEIAQLAGIQLQKEDKEDFILSLLKKLAADNEELLEELQEREIELERPTGLSQTPPALTTQKPKIKTPWKNDKRYTVGEFAGLFNIDKEYVRQMCRKSNNPSSSHLISLPPGWQALKDGAGWFLTRTGDPNAVSSFEAARLLSCSTQQINRMVKDGDLLGRPSEKGFEIPLEALA